MTCSKCGAQATSVLGVTLVTCSCKAPIVAAASATMKGQGGLKP